MDTYNPSKLTAAPKKVDISLRQLADFDQTGGDRDRVDNVRDNQVLVSLSKLERPKTFSFRYISDILLGGNGITIATNSNGITTISNSGVRKIIAGSNITISPITGVGDVTIDAASSSLAVGTTPITSGGVGRVLFEGTGNVLQESANFFWDNTNSRLGIGTASPTEILEISSTGTTGFAVKRNALSNSGRFFLKTSGTYNWSIGLRATRNDFSVFNESSSEAFTINATTNNVLINTTTDAGYKLDVNGTVRLSDVLSFTNFSSLTPQGTTAADRRLLIRGGEGGGVGSTSLITLTTSNNITSTSGNPVLVNISRDFTPTSGTATYALASITGTINQTGGANGITRGLYVNPTLTAAADFRAIETTVGKVCLNTTSGNTMIGTTTDAGFKLDVNGTARVISTLTSSTDIFRVTNGVAANVLRVKANGDVVAGGSSDFGLGNGAGIFMRYSLRVGALSYADASAVLHLDSTTKGVLFPRMTTTEKNAIASPAAGLVVYDTTLGKLCVRGAAAWETITSV